MTKAKEKGGPNGDRDSRHDEICLLLCEMVKVAETDAVVTIEAALGRGYCDLFVEAADHIVLFEVKTDNEKASAGDVIRQLRFYEKAIEAYIEGYFAFCRSGYEYKARYMAYREPRYVMYDVPKPVHLYCVCESRPVSSFIDLLKNANVELLFLENGEITGAP